MKQDMLDGLIIFLHEESGSYEVPITLDTSIENDLGVTGEDGDELIVKFSRKYNVNITNFHFNKYFYPEYFGGHKPDYKIDILTVGHLLKAIEAGRLDDEIINSSYKLVHHIA